MHTRRNVLIKTGLMLLGVALTSACRSWQKNTLQDKQARSALSNSIWLPNWRMQKSLDSTLTALQQGCVNTVSPFWYDVNDDGVLTAKPGSDGLHIPDNATLEALKKQGAIITPTLTTTLKPDDFIRLFSARAVQQSLAEAIRQEVLTNGYDGVGLDLECIALTTDIPTAKKVRAIYTDLCRCISTALASVNKTLAITVMARWSDDYAVWRGKLIPAVYDYKALSEVASVLRVMAYDQHAPNTPPGPMAGFPWVKAICDWTRRNVRAADRVEIGIPLYGRDWGGGKVKSVLHNNVAQLRKMYPHAEVSYSAIEKEETFTYVSAEGDKHTVWYSSNQSVTDRLALIRRYGFRGGAFWAASYENPSLWDAIHAADV